MGLVVQSLCLGLMEKIWCKISRPCLLCNNLPRAFVVGMLFSWARDVASRDRIPAHRTCDTKRRGMTLSRQRDCIFAVLAIPCRTRSTEGKWWLPRKQSAETIAYQDQVNADAHAQQKKGSRDARMPGTKEILINHTKQRHTTQTNTLVRPQGHQIIRQNHRPDCSEWGIRGTRKFGPLKSPKKSTSCLKQKHLGGASPPMKYSRKAVVTTRHT